MWSTDCVLQCVSVTRSCSDLGSSGETRSGTVLISRSALKLTWTSITMTAVFIQTVDSPWTYKISTSGKSSWKKTLVLENPGTVLKVGCSSTWILPWKVCSLLEAASKTTFFSVQLLETVNIVLLRIAYDIARLLYANVTHQKSFEVHYLNPRIWCFWVGKFWKVELKCLYERC